MNHVLNTSRKPKHWWETYRFIALAPFALFGLAGCNQGTFPLVGFDGNGKAIEAYVDEAQYESRLEQVILESHRSMIPVLDARSYDNKKWELQLAVLGFGVKASAGFGPFQLGISPGMRAFFTNQTNPPPLP